MTTGALLCSSAMTTTMYARGARRGSSTALRWCLTRTANNNQGQPCAPTRQHGRVATLGTTHGFSTARRVETTRAVSDNAAGTSPEQQQRQPNNGKQLAQTPPHTQRSAVPVQNRMPHKSTTNSGVSAQPQQHGPTPQSNAQWQQREQQRQQPPRGGGGNTNNGYNNNGGAGAAAAGFQRQNNNGVGYAQAGGRSMLPQEIDALYHQMQHLGSKWADLHAEAELLEESKKCVLASITLHYMNDGDSKSSGESKSLTSSPSPPLPYREAFAAPEYAEHISKMVEARRKANQAKVEFEGIKTHMNLTRTYEATRRAEMQLL